MASFVSYDPYRNDIHIGDLIEIDRGNYSHWALCGVIEKNVVWCFHVSKTRNTVPKTSNKKNACIRYDKLTDILNRIDSISKYRVNNQNKKAAKILDNDITRMPDIDIVINLLHNKIDEEVEYDPKHKNCEHYATSWKYDTGFSEHSKTQHNLVNLGFATATGIGGATFLGAAGLTAAGFSSAGIVGGSIAAGIQSSIGSVAAGSTFATLQSAGATGLIATVGAGAAAFTLPVAAIGFGYYLYSRRTVCAEYNE